MFIIEGGDCLGKSTLAHSIVDYVRTKCVNPVAYCHLSRPREEYFDFCHDYKKLMATHLVYDRFHLGGLAYHEEKFSADSIALVESEIGVRGGFVVIMYCSDHRWYENRLKNDPRGNMLDVPAMMEANVRFSSMVSMKSVRFDVAFDLKANHSTTHLFPVPEQFEVWAQRWQRRLELHNGR